MKKILKCRVTLFLLTVWIGLSIIGFLGKNSCYSNYSGSFYHTPYFVFVLQGLHDGIYPWSKEMNESVGEIEKVEPEEGIAATEATEAATETEMATEKLPLTKTFVAVDENYFDDAVFIGDSRTVGLHDYGGLENATFFASLGLNVYDMWKDAFCEQNGKKVTLEEALLAKQYKKIYFQIGINEMGRGTIDSFMEAYEQAVLKFRQLQPEATIYVQGIMRVAKEKTQTDPIFNNSGIIARNERIASLADEQQIFYIDVNDVVCDEEGNLKEELTFDNVHLYGSKYNIWVDFLKTKGIVINES